MTANVRTWDGPRLTAQPTRAGHVPATSGRCLPLPARRTPRANARGASPPCPGTASRPCSRWARSVCGETTPCISSRTTAIATRSWRAACTSTTPRSGTCNPPPRRTRSSRRRTAPRPPRPTTAARCGASPGTGRTPPGPRRWSRWRRFPSAARAWARRGPERARRVGRSPWRTTETCARWRVGVGVDPSAPATGGTLAVADDRNVRLFQLDASARSRPDGARRRERRALRRARAGCAACVNPVTSCWRPPRRTERRGCGGTGRGTLPTRMTTKKPTPPRSDAASLRLAGRGAVCGVAWSAADPWSFASLEGAAMCFVGPARRGRVRGGHVTYSGVPRGRRAYIRHAHNARRARDFQSRRRRPHRKGVRAFVCAGVPV